MNEQSTGFELRPVIQQKSFENPVTQSFFAEWCRKNNHIELKVIERNEWEEKENILEKRDDNKGNLYIPKDLQLWEMVPIVEAIDKDTFIDKPERQDKAKEKLIELGKTFRDSGIYIAQRLDFINEGKEIAKEIAEEFYNYGELIINGKKSEKDKTIEEIKLENLTEEETNKIDYFLAGEELFKSIKNRIDKKEIDIEIERQKTLNRFFKVSEKAFRLQQRSETGNKFISKINKLIKKEVETPETELYSSIFRRGMDMLQKDMPFDKLPESVKNNFLHWQKGETTLRQALQIDKLKTELDMIRQGGDKVLISNKERAIVNTIQEVISNFPRKKGMNNPSEMIINQEINCVGASMLSGALMQEIGLNYLVGRVPKHSILFLITSDNKIEWRDMLNPYEAILTNNEIKGQKNDGSPITVKDILDFSKNPKLKSLTFDIKGGEYRKKFFWVKEGQRQLVTVSKPEHGHQIQLLESVGIRLSNINPEKEANNDNINHKKEAIKIFQKIIDIDPEYFYAYDNLGIIFNKLEFYEEAAKAYLEVIRIDPKNIEVYNKLGVVLHTLGRNEEAINIYQKALDIDPKFAIVYYNLGNALSSFGHDKEAILVFKFFINQASDKQKNNYFVTEIGEAKEKIKELENKGKSEEEIKLDLYIKKLSKN